MKLILILLVALYSYSSDAGPGDADPSDPCQYKCFNCTRLDGQVFDILRTDPDQAWQRYKAANKLSYPNPDDDKMRNDLFNKCLAKAQSRIRSCNAGTNKDKTHNYGLPPLCHLTPEELQARNGVKPPRPRNIDDNKSKRRKRSYSYSASCQPANAYLPASYDARSLSQVTPVKNQGNCGSCWAFSSTASVEHQYLKLTGQIKNGSEQHLVNCAETWNGCNGGWPDAALAYIQTYGSPPAATVPYTASYFNTTCSKCPIANEMKIQDWCMWGTTWCYSNGSCIQETFPNSLIMQSIYKYGSVVFTLNAKNLGQSYTGGIYSYSSCPTTLTHAVLAVGWGTQKGVNYWIIKNSWGSTWGESGYFRIVRGVNMCGIESMVWWPIITNKALYTKSC